MKWKEKKIIRQKQIVLRRKRKSKGRETVRERERGKKTMREKAKNTVENVKIMKTKCCWNF